MCPIGVSDGVQKCRVDATGGAGYTHSLVVLAVPRVMYRCMLHCWLVDSFSGGSHSGWAVCELA